METKKNFGPFLYRNQLWVIRVSLWVVLLCFRVRENIVAASCILYSSLIIVKSLQLRGCRQAKLPNHVNIVLCVWLFFFDVCFLYLFCFSQVGIFVKIPYNVVCVKKGKWGMKFGYMWIWRVKGIKLWCGKEEAKFGLEGIYAKICVAASLPINV